MRKPIKVLIALTITTALLLVAVPVMFLGKEDATTASKIVLNNVAGFNVDSPSQAVIDQRFKLPPGFVASVYATGLGKARLLHMTVEGDLLVTQPRQGQVTLLKRDSNRDHLPDGQVVLLKDLTRPHGIELVDGWLYIAESNQVGRIAFDTATGQVSGDYQVLLPNLADHGGHWTKTLRAGDDGWMYYSSGSTCNVCEEDDPHRAAISRFKLADEKPVLKVFATGLRNSVGLDWSPWEQALYATDNGRDWLGDEYPPCELNKITLNGFYGWPYINGFGDLDPDYGQGRGALLATAINPVHGFRAHNAPLGMRFIRQTVLPAGYQRAALVALHGSWNRSTRDGYKVVSLHWQADGSVQERDFMTGFLRSDDQQGEQVIGRPVDIAEGNDGALYVSDDYSGTIFKVMYQGETKAQRSAHWPFIAQGELIFSQYGCARCHDPVSLKRGRRLVDLTGLADKYSEQTLADYFLTPAPPMPLYPLDDVQRLSLARYLLSR